jgi:short-subunit dehydrogenase
MLISNAGASGYPRLVDVDPADVDRLLTLNAVAPIQLVRAALPGMLTAGEGTIVTSRPATPAREHKGSHN